MSKWKDLFQSEAERNREKAEFEATARQQADAARRAREREIRKAERAVEDKLAEQNRRIEELEKDRKKYWDRARDDMKAGRRHDAKLHVQYFRKYSMQLLQYERKAAILEYQFELFRSCQSAKDVTQAMNDLSKYMSIDVDSIAAKWDVVGAKMDDMTEIDLIFNDLFNEGMRDDSLYDRDAVRSVDELLDEIQEEIVAEIGGGAAANAAGEGSIEREIASGRGRLNDIISSSDKSGR